MAKAAYQEREVAGQQQSGWVGGIGAWSAEVFEVDEYEGYEVDKIGQAQIRENFSQQVGGLVMPLWGFETQYNADLDQFKKERGREPRDINELESFAQDKNQKEWSRLVQGNLMRSEFKRPDLVPAIPQINNQLHQRISEIDRDWARRITKNRIPVVDDLLKVTQPDVLQKLSELPPRKFPDWYINAQAQTRIGQLKTKINTDLGLGGRESTEKLELLHQAGIELQKRQEEAAEMIEIFSKELQRNTEYFDRMQRAVERKIFLVGEDLNGHRQDAIDLVTRLHKEQRELAQGLKVWRSHYELVNTEIEKPLEVPGVKPFSIKEFFADLKSNIRFDFGQLQEVQQLVDKITQQTSAITGTMPIQVDPGSPIDADKRRQAGQAPTPPSVQAGQAYNAQQQQISGLISAQDASKKFGVSIQSLRRWYKDGIVEGEKRVVPRTTKQTMLYINPLDIVKQVQNRGGTPGRPLNPNLDFDLPDLSNLNLSNRD